MHILVCPSFSIFAVDNYNAYMRFWYVSLWPIFYMAWWSQVIGRIHSQILILDPGIFAQPPPLVFWWESQGFKNFGCWPERVPGFNVPCCVGGEFGYPHRWANLGSLFYILILTASLQSDDVINMGGNKTVGVDFSIPETICITVFNWTLISFVYMLPAHIKGQYSAAEKMRAKEAVCKMSVCFPTVPQLVCGLYCT